MKSCPIIDYFKYNLKSYLIILDYLDVDNHTIHIYYVLIVLMFNFIVKICFKVVTMPQIY